MKRLTLRSLERRIKKLEKEIEFAKSRGTVYYDYSKSKFLEGGDSTGNFPKREVSYWVS